MNVAQNCCRFCSKIDCKLQKNQLRFCKKKIKYVFAKKSTTFLQKKTSTFLPKNNTILQKNELQLCNKIDCDFLQNYIHHYVIYYPKQVAGHKLVINKY